MDLAVPGKQIMNIYCILIFGTIYKTTDKYDFHELIESDPILSRHKKVVSSYNIVVYITWTHKSDNL